MLEPIILSVLGPTEQISLRTLCARLLTHYGVIVGGTEADRTHLDAWDITIGSSSIKSDPLSNRNYEVFKQAVIDIGHAREFADGVTIVSPPGRWDSMLSPPTTGQPNVMSSSPMR